MKRLLTAFALLAVALYLIFWAPGPVFVAAAVLMGLLCYYEFSGLVVRYGIKKPDIFGALAGLLMLFWPQEALLGILLLLLTAFSLSLKQDNLRDILPQIACSLLGAFYTIAPWRMAIDLQRVSVHLLFFALAINWIGDTAAYYAGRRLGRHKLAPVVSPRKTWEGAAASVAAGTLFGLLYLPRVLSQIPWWEITAMAIAGNIAGQLGDLAESAIKRGADVKDSGTMLPGHGGMLDRVDSSLFALPVVYGIYLGFAFLRASLT